MAADKEFRHLKRRDLLEMLLMQNKRIERLQETIKNLENTVLEKEAVIREKDQTIRDMESLSSVASRMQEYLDGAPSISEPAEKGKMTLLPNKDQMTDVLNRIRSGYQVLVKREGGAADSEAKKGR